MPGCHKWERTIAFRPSSQWEYSLIQERMNLSGMKKKDFISRSIIYSHICMVGSKENVKIIVDEVKEMQLTMKEIASGLSNGDFLLSEESFTELKNDVLALAVTVVDILNGAAYLFEKEPVMDNQHWKSELEIGQLKDCLNLAAKPLEND